MLFSLLLAGIAVFLSIPVFSGKGKLMNTDNIKKDKVNVFKKWIRILYALMMVMLLVMAFLNFAEKVAYTQVDIYEFTEDYMGKDEVLHPAGEQHTREAGNPHPHGKLRQLMLRQQHDAALQISRNPASSQRTVFLRRKDNLL